MERTYTEESTIPFVPTDGTFYYPDEDGQPRSAGDFHLRQLFYTWQTLEAHFAQTPDVYVSGDIIMYYKERDPRKYLSPDVLVCFGINPEMKHTFKIWEEGKAPDIAMEFVCERTYHYDLNVKTIIYASLEIQDYFLYDPEGVYLPSPLMGFTLVDGVYETIQPDEHEGLRSSVLGLDFRLQDSEIRIFDPIENGWLKTKAEKEAERADIAAARAEVAMARAKSAKVRAENAEAELAQLREELARLRASRE